MSFNSHQEKLKQAYGGGDFAYVTNMDDVEACGDTLFLFLMRELSDNEDCRTTEEAVHRIREAISDLESALKVLDPDVSDVFAHALRDWRIGHGHEEEVPEALRGPFMVTVVKGGYEHLQLAITSPEDHRSVLHLEAENGHVKLLIHCPDKEDPKSERDELDAVIRITRTGVLAYGDQGDSPGLVVDGDAHEVLTPRALAGRLASLEAPTS